MLSSARAGAAFWNLRRHFSHFGARWEIVGAATTTYDALESSFIAIWGRFVDPGVKVVWASKIIFAFVLGSCLITFRIDFLCQNQDAQGFQD